MKSFLKKDGVVVYKNVHTLPTCAKVISPDIIDPMKKENHFVFQTGQKLTMIWPIIRMLRSLNFVTMIAETNSLKSKGESNGSDRNDVYVHQLNA